MHHDTLSNPTETRVAGLPACNARDNSVVLSTFRLEFTGLGIRTGAVVSQ